VPRRKKKAREMTTEETLRRLFPKPVIRKLKEIAASEKPRKQRPK